MIIVHGPVLGLVPSPCGYSNLLIRYDSVSRVRYLLIILTNAS